MGTPKATRAAVAARRARAIQLRMDGHGWQEIADTLGYSTRGAAHTDVRRALEANLKQLALATEQLREVELLRLDEMQREVVAVLRAEHPLVSAGEVVYDRDRDEAGEPIPGTGSRLTDAGPKLAAIDRLLRIGQQRARLLGLEAPQLLETGGVVRYVIEGVDLTKLT